MRKIVWMAAIAFLVMFPAVFFEDPASGEGTGDVLFYEINPIGDFEGISLFNYGSQDVNLKGWSLSDTEGTLSFTGNIYVQAGTRITIAKSSSADDWFSGRDRVITFDDDRIQKKGSFVLANTGDDVFLYKGDMLMDSVCYGNKPTEYGWKGEPVDLPSSKYLLRISSYDTDTLSDWISTKPGLTNHTFDPELYFDASVTPFSFPESMGIPIFKEIECAEHEVLISIYLLTSAPLVALLCDLASEKGVMVRMILEGDVLGIDMTTELTLMRSLVDAGGEVYLINDPEPGNYERFSFFHNKYAVIDGRKVIVTSENWTAGNLSRECSNRGWGAVIESEDLAEYVKEVFYSDLNPEYGDVRSLLHCYPGLKPYQGALTYAGAETEYETTTFDARVMPILSPDDSKEAMRHLIDNAESRVYSQQLDLGSSFRTINDVSPVGWMSSAAERGVDARLIIDASTDGEGKEEAVNLINNTTAVKALAISGKEGFSMIHNKGVVVDDIVWVGSVNWTETSFTNNREFAVLIDSAEAAEFFAGLFIEDWGVNEHTVAEVGIEIAHTLIQADGGTVHVFTVSGPERASYTWDVLGDGTIRNSSINRIVCTGIPPGTYIIKVMMDGTGHSAELEYTAGPEERPPAEESSYLWSAAAAGIAAAAGAGFIYRRRNNNP